MIGNLFELRLAREKKGGRALGSWLSLQVHGKSHPVVVLCFSSRTAWVQKIKAASEQYIDTEKKKREKAYQGSGSCPAGWEPATRGPWGAGVVAGGESSSSGLSAATASVVRGQMGNERPARLGCGFRQQSPAQLPPQLFQT